MKKLRYLFIFCCTALLAAGCGTADEGPIQERASYQQAVSDFYMSLAASQTDQSRFAFNKMNDVALAFPEEAAAWANLGVLAMRQGNFDLSDSRFERALEVAPQNADVLFLSSVMESRRGNTGEAIGYLRTAVAHNPDHKMVLFALANELEREGAAESEDEIAEWLAHLQSIAPDNQPVMVERARTFLRKGEFDAAAGQLDRLLAERANLPDEILEQADVVRNQIGREDAAGAILELSLLRTGLQSTETFQQQLLEIELPPADLGYLIPHFINLPQPQIKAAEPDMEMQFTEQPLDLVTATVGWVKGVSLLETAAPFPISVGEGQLTVDDETLLPYPGEADARLHPNAVTEIDYNYTFRNDLAAAGSSGFRLYRQEEDETFTDVTSLTGLSASVVNGRYRGVWAFDLEADGDLDLLLAADDAPPTVLRNNGDGTFTSISLFNSVRDITEFFWADLAGDGVADPVFLTVDGELVALKNHRANAFGDPHRLADNVVSATIADLSADGRFEVVAVQQSGRILSFRFTPSMSRLLPEQQEIGSVNFSHQPTAASATLFSADIDNNGALDLVITTTEETLLLLGDEDRALVPASHQLPGRIYSVFDLDGNERLDLLGIHDNGTPFVLKNEGTKGYFARSIRARASGAEGDRRINSFGIGGEMEIRSGVLYQKQAIQSPIVHFGLGTHEEAEMLRIIWPNGSVQAEFAELGMGATIFNEQVLKGSCPWLFTCDGSEIHFITDALWRSPLGLRINAQETAGVIQTYDRVVIPGHKLNPKEGVYDVRITAELWETHFFDYTGLKAVDHPEGTQILVDERFVFPAPDLTTRLAGPSKPVVQVIGDDGTDGTERVSEMNGRYFRPFSAKTIYQGITEPYTFEVQLPEDVLEAPHWLTLSGWLHPTDSSINLAISQGENPFPTGMKIEISNNGEQWSVLYDDYGVPAGKTKTILVDVEEVFDEGASRPSLRFTSTSEIYWDGIFVAEKLDESLMNER
ncbi:MAG: FG-GAP-like repeat-containing protein, partial [Balneolaceae bacterium]